MRRLALAAMLLLLALPQAGAQGLGQRWATLFLARLLPGHSSIDRLYAGREAIIAQYTVAMRRYKAAGERSAGQRMAIAFQPRDQLPALEPYTWIAANGDMVRRTGSGVFALAVGNPLGNWFTDITCEVTLWPTLICSDNRERKISAPDLATVVVDGVEFKRPYPLTQVLPDEPLPTDVDAQN